MNSLQKYSLAFLLALSLHFLIGGMFVFNFTSEPQPAPKVQQDVPEIIQASILDEAVVEEKAQALKQAEVNRQLQQQSQRDKFTRQLKQEKLQLQRAKKRRLEEENKAKQQAQRHKKAEQKEQKRLLAVKQRIALEKKETLAKEKKQAVEKARIAEERRVAAEKQEQAAVAKEAARLKAEKQQKIIAAQKQREKIARQKIAAAKQAEANRVRAENARIARKASADAKALIKRKITQNWNQPATASKGLSCTIKVGLISSGDVMSVSVIKSSGNRLFDDSAERAVYKASPLPVPKDPNVFKKFRNFTFEFAPSK